MNLMCFKFLWLSNMVFILNWVLMFWIICKILEEMVVGSKWVDCVLFILMNLILFLLRLYLSMRLCVILIVFVVLLILVELFSLRYLVIFLRVFCLFISK